MARWAQFGFIVVCLALGLGVYLGNQGSRSLEKLTEDGSVSDQSDSLPALRSGPLMGTPEKPSSEGPDPVKTVEAGQPPANRELTDRAELEILEAKQSVLALLDENEKIRKEVLDLEKQIRRLTHSLAEEKLENDRNRVKIGELEDQRTEVRIPGPSIPEFCEVIDVNEELNLVVLNRGTADGIQHGLQLTVIREGSRIAELEAVNVRTRITGAAITFLKDSEAIVAGDRVVPSRH